MNAFEEETKGDGILLFYIFLREYVGYTKEAVIAAEQQLTKEKLALENFNHDITKFTSHVHTHIRKIMNASSPVTNQHFILVFSALKESEEDEFKLIIMQLYEGWRTGKSEGADISMLQLLARANTEYKRLLHLNQWNTKNKTSELLGLQAKFDNLQIQFAALLAAQAKNQKPPPTSNCPTGEPKPEEKEERMINGKKWYYCTNCWSGRRWNKTHKTADHKKGVGKNAKLDKDEDSSQQAQQANTAALHSGFGADFMSG
jgi:hypothetical protein